MKRPGGPASRFVLATVACAGVLVAVGAVFAAVTEAGIQVSVASALFIGAAALIAFNALGESGARDRGFDLRTGWIYPRAGSGPRGSLSWVLVGVVLIALGVLVLVL
jgi:hypothetical protein